MSLLVATIIMELWWNDTDRERLKWWEENLS
jgi:hypothetical protein